MSSPDPSVTTLTIQLNGQPREIPAGTTVAGLLALLEIATVRVAVERNREVVRRAAHDTCVLEAGDVVEIVSFVGGG